MTASSSQSSSDIEVGTRVRLKTTTIGESLGIKPFRKRGGEAKVVSIVEDSKGFAYTVQLLTNGRVRTVRREHLVLHRHQPTPRPTKGKNKCASQR